MRNPGRTRRPDRVVAGSVVLAVSAWLLSGCSGFATDTPLGVTSRHRAYSPGTPVTGKVIYPDGAITVTVAPASSVPVDGHRTQGERSCRYRPGAAFSCETSGLPEGLTWSR